MAAVNMQILTRLTARNENAFYQFHALAGLRPNDYCRTRAIARFGRSIHYALLSTVTDLDGNYAIFGQIRRGLWGERHHET